MSLKLELTGIIPFLNWQSEKEKLTNEIKNIHQKLNLDQELKNKYLGWQDLPDNINDLQIDEIIQLSRKNKDLDVLVVIGIGGSYLGAKAGIDFLTAPFCQKKPQIIFAGHQVSGDYLNHLLNWLQKKNWALNVISKSGTTLEPALAFRILKKAMEDQYGKVNSKERIFITTDLNKGLLKKLADQEGYQQFIIPSSIGGRFSVLTAVGMLPFAFANLDIKAMLQGAKQAYLDTKNDNIDQNQAYQYAALRYLLHTQMAKKIELLVTYEPCCSTLGQWWTQLFAESEGKDEKGLFVSSLNNSTDLHSLGQFIQEGSKIIFETIINIQNMPSDCEIPKIKNDLDKLNYLSGKKFMTINQKILQATKQAHIEGKVPNIEIIINQKDEYHFGYLVYFFQKACSVSGLLLKVNPFNQPGVEIYKQKMHHLLKH